MPYSKIALPNSLFGLPVLAVLAISVFARACFRLGFWSVALASAAAFPGAVLARILVEAAASPKTHNLWPFELIIASIAGLIAGAVGSWLGGAADSLVRKRDS